MELKLFLNRGENPGISEETLDALSAAQKARIIYHRRNATLADKHHSLQEIIDTLPDEVIHCTNFETKLPFEQSLHQLLRDYMAEQKRLETAFFATEPEVVYLVSLSQPFTGEYWNSETPSLSWEACARKLSDYLEWHEATGPWCAEVTKYYPKVFLNGFMRALTAVFNEQGELLDITCQIQMPMPRFRDLSWHMELLPTAEALYAPAPFKKGDILGLKPGLHKKYPKLPQGPMLVMEEPNPEQETLCVFCFDLYAQHPELLELHPKLLHKYEAINQSSDYLILKEVASALERGYSLATLNQRIGAAITFPVERFFLETVSM